MTIRRLQLASVFIAFVLVVSAAGYGITRGIADGNASDDRKASAECEALLDSLNNVGWFGYTDVRLLQACNMKCQETNDGSGRGRVLECGDVELIVTE